MLNRRRFLAAAALIPAAPRLAAGRSAPGPRDRSISEVAWRDLSRAGMLLREGSANFAGLVRPQNLRYGSVRPAALIRCAGAEGVRHAITWARLNGMPFVLRNGGHSYAGTSVVEGGLIIDLRPMNAIALRRGGLLDIAGGALNADAYTALRRHGLALTHGRCLGVGISGFLMGGGIGFSMREHGLGCDAVEEADLLLPDGRILTASARNEPDVFWAVRGGGGGTFGAVLGWRIRPVPAYDVTVFKCTWNRDVEEVFWRLTQVLEAAPPRMGAKLTVHAVPAGSGQTPTVHLMGQWRGMPQEVEAILAPVGAASRRNIVHLGYWQGQDALSEAGPPAHYQETSHYAGRLPQACVEEIFRYCRNWPGTSGEAAFKMFQLGGRIREIPSDATAYVHRTAEWLTGTELVWTPRDGMRRVEESLAWQRAFHHAVVHATGGPGGSYQNFLDPALEDPARAYYGANLPRLAAIKARLDPEGAFTPPRRQGIAV